MSSILSPAAAAGQASQAATQAGRLSAMERCAATDLWKFCFLGLQISLLFAVFQLYQIENQIFSRMVAIAFAAFVVHYWLPFRFKEPFLVLASLGAAFYLLDVQLGAMLIGVGLLFFLTLRLPIGFRWRLALIASLFAALIYGNA